MQSVLNDAGGMHAVGAMKHGDLNACAQAWVHACVCSCVRVCVCPCVRCMSTFPLCAAMPAFTDCIPKMPFPLPKTAGMPGIPPLPAFPFPLPLPIDAKLGTATAGGPKGLGAACGGPKGLGAAWRAPKGLAAARRAPKGLGAVGGGAKGLGAAGGAPPNMPPAKLGIPADKKCVVRK